MHTNERETAEIMIERNFRIPAGSVMTLLAVLVRLPFMHIIKAMTADTVGGGLLVIQVAFVTGNALCSTMFAGQSKFRIPVVIESHF